MGANDHRGADPSVFTCKALVQPICHAEPKGSGFADPSHCH